MGKHMKQNLNKKSIVITSIVCACVLALGIAGGTILGKLVFVQEADHSNLDINALEDNQSALMSKYKNAGSLTLEQYKSKFKPYELANIALNKTGEHENFRSVGKGLVLANVSGIKVNQDIRSNTVKIGDSIMSESISASSMIKLAKRFYQDKTSVKYYSGDYKELEHCIYKDANLKQTYNLKDFDEEWGREFTRPTIYIISSKTVKEATASIDNGELNISLELDPFTSVARYVKQMRMTSDLKKDPNFSKVHIDFKIDSSMNLISTTTDEVYKTYYAGIWADTSGTLTETRYYDEAELTLPSLSEDCNYK